MWRAKYLTWGIRVDDPGCVKTRARLITAEVSDSSSAQSSAACVLDPAYTTR